MKRIPEREAAKAAGKRFYETGKPCRNGHISKRYTANGLCTVCAIKNTLASLARRPDHPVRILARAAGEVHFSTSEPCQNGHDAPRFVSNGQCTVCAAARRDAAAVTVFHPTRTDDDSDALVLRTPRAHHLLRSCSAGLPRPSRRTWTGSLTARISAHQLPSPALLLLVSSRPAWSICQLSPPGAGGARARAGNRVVVQAAPPPICACWW